MKPPVSLLKWQKDFAQVFQGFPRINSWKGFKIYQEAYWGRLEKFLRRYYPSLPKLLGHDIWIDKIAYPFIAENPVQNWALEEWTKGLFDWLVENKKGSLSPLLMPLAQVERLHIEVFLSASFSRPSLEGLSTISFFLQPHVRFLSCSYDLLSYRKALLDGLQLPPLREIEEKWIALSLGETGEVLLAEIGGEEKSFLEACNGRTLQGALQHLSEQAPQMLILIQNKIQEWTGRWIKYNWMGEKYDKS